jgi:hypothetical protein
VVQSALPPAKSSKFLQGIFGLGRAEGEAIFFDQALEFTQLSPTQADKVVIAHSIGSTASLFKAGALGIKAIVVGWASPNLLEEIKEALGQAQDFGFLVLREGEEKKIIESLKKLAGKKVKVDGEKRKLIKLT